MSKLVSWCFEPSQPQRITSGLKDGKKTINRELTALDRQRTQQQRPKSSVATPPGMQVNTRYMNSTKGTSPKYEDGQFTGVVCKNRVNSVNLTLFPAHKNQTGRPNSEPRLLQATLPKQVKTKKILLGSMRYPISQNYYYCFKVVHQGTDSLQLSGRQ